MLDDFNIADRRQMVRYEVDWDKHFVLTLQKNPSHIVLNMHQIRSMDYKQYEKLAREIWDYTCS